MVTTVLSVMLFLACATDAFAAPSSRPHIVFIIADDLYYVSPICSPTRSAIMTGRHPIHTGMQVGVIGGATPYGLPLNETIMAQHLEPLGYRRHIVGKWHLGFFSDAYLPTKRGFESHFGYYTGHEDYFDHEAQDGFWGLDIHRDGVTQWDLFGNFSTEMYTQEAENIVHNHNASEPLFLYLAHQAVHAGNGPDPLQVPQSYVDRFSGKINDVKRRIFAGMVSALDDSVGRVVAALKETGLLENTIIVFTTDNGGPTNNYDGNAACNWPLRGVKNTMWEGGVRGVGLINSPLLGSTSYISENFFHVTDWLPTLYRAAGGDPSTLKNLDGYDMFDMLRKNGSQVRTEVLHNIDPVNNFSAIRVGDYKLVTGHISNNDNSWYPPPELSSPPDAEKNNDVLKFSSELKVNKKTTDLSVSQESQGRSPGSGQAIVVNCGPKPLNASVNCVPEKSPCLFHIPSDPCEYNNLAGMYPDKVQELLKRIDQYRSTMVPPGNKPKDPKGDPFLHGGDWKPWM
ncbi:hypothetical protein BaRGS_00013080 [Batillaria attramentaria]|uniref:Sulfatase N-terminal domain-containing protein n=1 Tax=Batillaria attramentaria TaxID=370345 RepID=A0ABD0L8M7_9CAEN